MSNKYICFSGGAKGSDLVFENQCIKYNIDVVAFSFFGHQTYSKFTKILKEDVLKKTDSIMKKVNETFLHRKFPTNKEYVNNLIRRNFFQVKYSDEIFAICTIKNNIIDGGTAWAVYLAILANKTVHIFEQNENKWYEWKDGFVESETAPVLCEKFAGIGTRDINDNGIKAIENLFINSFKSNDI